MKLTEYQTQTERTCPDLGTLEENLRHMRLGVITEFGELLDPIKKHLAYGKDLDLVNLGEELADITWYVTNEARMLGVIFSGKEKYEPFEMETLNEFVDEMTSSLEYYIGSNRDVEFFNFIILDVMSAAKFLNLDIENLWNNNIDKLRVRFPDKFDKTLAVNRNLEAERIELEK